MFAFLRGRRKKTRRDKPPRRRRLLPPAGRRVVANEEQQQEPERHRHHDNPQQRDAPPPAQVPAPPATTRRRARDAPPAATGGTAAAPVLGYTPLERASFHGNMGRVRHWIVVYQQEQEQQQTHSTTNLVEQEINRPNLYGRTALRSAAVQGHTAIVSLLLENGAHVRQCDNSGYTPLYYAAQYGHVDTVKLLLQQLEREEEQQYYVATTDEIVAILAGALEAACIAGHVNVVRLLVASISVMAKHEHTAAVISLHQDALTVAALYGHDEVLKVLMGLEEEAEEEDPSRRHVHSACSTSTSPLLNVDHCHPAPQEQHHNNSGDGTAGFATGIPLTALGCACLYGHAKATQILLEHGGASPNQRDGEGRTVLHYALEGWRSNSNANNSAASNDSTGSNQQHAAATLLRLVPRRETRIRPAGGPASSRPSDSDYETMQNQQVQVLQLLLRHGADTTLVDPITGQQPLVMIAAAASSAATCSMTTNDGDDNGESGRLTAIYLLLQHGVGDGSIQLS